MKKKIIAVTASLLVIVLISVSFGTSQTGLFHLTGEPEIIRENINTNKWEAVGSVNVSLGSVSNLGS